MIPVDSNIPMPASKVGRPVLYPFKHLEVGESFFIPKSRRKIGSLIMRNSRKLRRTFESRQWEQDGVQGIRVWRTA